MTKKILVGTFLSIASFLVVLGLFMSKSVLVGAQIGGTLVRADDVAISINDVGVRAFGLSAIAEGVPLNLSVDWWEGEAPYLDLDVEIYALKETELLRYLTYGYDESGSARSKVFDPANLALVSTLDLPRYLPKSSIPLPVEGNGVWLLRILKDDISYSELALVRSSFGTIAREMDTEMLLWSQRFEDGAHVTSGSVDFYNLEESPRRLVRTNIDGATGLSYAPLLPEADVAIVHGPDESLTLVVLNLKTANYGSPSFIPDNAHDKIYLFTDRPLYKPSDTVRFKAIVRRDDDALYSLSRGSMSARLYFGWDRSKVISQKTYQLDGNGTIEGEFVLPDDVKTGSYQIEVGNSQDTEMMLWLRTTTSFQVEHFRKPDYNLKVVATDDIAIRGDELPFLVSGEYFAGHPLSWASIKLETRKSGVTLGKDEASDDDLIRDRLSYERWYGKTLRLGEEVAFDELGQGEYILKTKGLESRESYNFDTPEESGVVTMIASYNDESANRVIASRNIFLHEGEYTIHAPYLSSVAVGEKVDIPITLVTHNDIYPGDQELEVKIRRTYYRQSADGANRISFTTAHEEYPKGSIKSSADGTATYSFTPKGEGTYHLSFMGKDRRSNTIHQVFSLYVYDKAGRADRSEDNFLILGLDRLLYGASQDAMLSAATSEPRKEALLTIERGSVRRHRVISLGELQSVHSIGLEANDLPNVYASVSLFAKDRYVEKMAKVSLDTSPKQLSVELTLDKESYAPGETARLSVKTTNKDGVAIPADVALYVVDKSLYELAGERREAIFPFFWGERGATTARANSLAGTSGYGGAEMGCFLPQTMILTPLGERPIEDISVGDTVLTLPFAGSDDLVPAKVTKTYEHQSSGYLILNGRLRVTPEHVVRVNGGWHSAGNVQVGDMLTESDGSEEPVTSIEWHRDVVTVHNFTVERYHTYIADGVWVHNQKGDGGTRDEFADVAYWNPHVKTNESGEATVTFKLPDNLTTWVVNAIGATPATVVGEDKGEFLVTKPLIVRPIAPPFVRVGDTIFPSAIVHNFTGADSDVRLACEFLGVRGEITSNIPNNRFSRLMLSAVGPSEPDSEAKMICEGEAANKDKDRDSIALTLPVHDFFYQEKKGDMVMGPGALSASLPDDANPASSTISVALVSSVYRPLPGDGGRLLGRSLLQRDESSAIEAVALALVVLDNASIYDRETVAKAHSTIAQEIPNLEKSYRAKRYFGALRLEGDSGLPYMAYVLRLIKEAEGYGYKMSADIVKAVLQDLEHEYATSLPAVEKAVIASEMARVGGEGWSKKLLTVEGHVDTETISYLTIANIENGHFDQKKNGLEELLLRSEVRDGLRYFLSYDEKGNIAHEKTAALNLRSLRALSLAGRETEARELLAYVTRYTNIDDEWSSYRSGHLYDALNTYAKAFNVPLRAPYKVLLGDEVLATGVFNAFDENVTFGIDANKLDENSKLAVAIPKESVIMAGIEMDVTRMEPTPESRQDGLSISRHYVGTLAPGETIMVSFEIEGLFPERSSIVVRDYLPSGIIAAVETLDNEVDTRGQGAGIHPIAVVYHEDGPELTFVSWGKDKMVASYRARVVSQGSYRAPPANVWYLGAWERSALSGGDTVIIGEVANSNARSVLLWLWIVSALVILIFTTVLVKRRRSSI